MENNSESYKNIRSRLNEARNNASVLRELLQPQVVLQAEDPYWQPEDIKDTKCAFLVCTNDNEVWLEEQKIKLEKLIETKAGESDSKTKRALRTISERLKELELEKQKIKDTVKAVLQYKPAQLELGFGGYLYRHTLRAKYGYSEHEASKAALALEQKWIAEFEDTKCNTSTRYNLYGWQYYTGTEDNKNSTFEEYLQELKEKCVQRKSKTKIRIESVVNPFSNQLWNTIVSRRGENDKLSKQTKENIKAFCKDYVIEESAVFLRLMKEEYDHIIVIGVDDEQHKNLFGCLKYILDDQGNVKTTFIYANYENQQLHNVANSTHRSGSATNSPDKETSPKSSPPTTFYLDRDKETARLKSYFLDAIKVISEDSFIGVREKGKLLASFTKEFVIITSKDNVDHEDNVFPDDYQDPDNMNGMTM